MIKKYVSDYKKLMAEWDYDANLDLEPNKLTAGSNKKAWWICGKCGHRWSTAIHNRALGNQDCPKCRYIFKKKITTNLTTTHNGILKYWNFEKNNMFSPDIFSQYSRQKVWWKCPDCNHEWEEAVKYTVKRSNTCPYCKKGIKDLFSFAPDIVSEWDYTRNETNPRYISYASNKYAWWKCSKCAYEWRAKISNRSILKRGCPCCAGNIVVPGVNDLKTKYPHIAKEWHSTKNGDWLPENFTYGVSTKVWWQCPLGHEYQATINHRTGVNGTGCPVCYSGRQTSFAEQAVYFYVSQLFPDAISRYKADFLGKMELDIYIPSMKYAIEYDGEAWHTKTKLEREKRKYKICKENGITLIRLREKMPDIGADVADYMIGMTNMYEHKKLAFVIRDLLVNYLHKPIMNIDLQRDKFKILEYNKSAMSDSLVSSRPDIAMEWHSTKNGNLLPNMFKAGSDHKVWWVCPICGNEYQSAISKRTDKKHGTGCPKCGKKKSDIAKALSVQMLDPVTSEVLKTFESITAAAKFTGQKTISNITMVCKGIRPKAGGYVWRYVDDTKHK